MADIAVVGMSCCYPGARSPQELWENVLAQRQAFRRIPPERLRLADYFSPDPTTPDKTYATQGALIEGYAFDRVQFRISGKSYRSSDLTHWLALDMAAQALTDAGFGTPESLPALTTRVIVGNTLTGEFSRANGLRLRWPYVRRVVEASLQQEGWSAPQCQDFLSRLETLYKAPFPFIDEETLAGGLSNTIAGRICNYFNLQGGGYTVDGACSSSLLAIATACTALSGGECDLALAGGVDLSLDPFELIGFAKTAALAAEEMYVFDAHSHGFIPGEGCGFVTLMRYEDALAQQRRIYALVRGWGISSDGSGGITRPEVEGQLLALTRAYERAGVDIGSVEYFEGHGTGTSIGDQTELQTLLQARRAYGSPLSPATIGSVKANIGHTKAAAGVAGFIKTVMALTTQVIPPTTGVRQPHPELLKEGMALMVRSAGALWPADRPLRAGVSAMGFGGINTHVVLEGVSNRRRTRLTSVEHTLLSSPQDAEVFLLAAQDLPELRQQVTHLLSFAARLSRAEFTDLSLQLLQTLQARPARAAALASRPAELADRLQRLQAALDGQEQMIFDAEGGIFMGLARPVPRIGFLFPGQGSPSYVREGLLRRRFDFIHTLYASAHLPVEGDEQDTAIAQPAIVTASLAGLRILKRLGITAEVGVGHSLGELTALCWAGAFAEESLQCLATARGSIMESLHGPRGSMVGVRASQEVVADLLTSAGGQVVIAGLNSPRQTVLAGETSAIAALVARARAEQIPVTPLKVSHAFHSPLMAPAVPHFSEALRDVRYSPLQGRVISTVTGALLEPEQDLHALLCEQITAPVRFVEALKQAEASVDLFIEVGPGQTLSRLAAEGTVVPALSVDVDGPTIKGLLQVTAAVFTMGGSLDVALLAHHRFHRPFDLNWQPRFFTNPCEQAPLPETEAVLLPSPAPLIAQEAVLEAPTGMVRETPATPAAVSDLLRHLVAQRVELPPHALENHHRMLSDLHLNSITVGQIVSEAARSLHLMPPAAPMEYADASLVEIAEALTELQARGEGDEEMVQSIPSGVDGWVRTFLIDSLEVPLQPAFAPLPREGEREQEMCAWKILAPAASDLVQELQHACACLSGVGVIVCLPPEPTQDVIPLLLHGAQHALRNNPSGCFVLVEHGGGGAAVARTLALEAPKLCVFVLDLPLAHPQNVAWILAEVREAQNHGGYREVLYNQEGRRSVPMLRYYPLCAEQVVPLPLSPDDVLLVTGGGKGIAAECAFSLALVTGVRLALIGRADPGQDTELMANLQRFEAARITYRYMRADVTSQNQIQEVIEELERTFGPITAFVHGAGSNVPRLLSSLTQEEFIQTLAPKVDGLQHVLSCLDAQKLRLLVTFGSVIARSGMRGEADYALANDWLARQTEHFQREHVACRCLCLEWSVWAGIGMGERLGRIEALIRQGILPIPVEQGVACFLKLLTQRLPATRVIVTSRFGSIPTLRVLTPELPLWRFLERPRVYYPGIELITDVEISTQTDPYVEGHTLHGERLLPAVVGLEAMAQMSMAVTGCCLTPHFEDVQLLAPLVVPPRGVLKIRLAALVAESGQVEVVIFSEETGFQVGHFRALCSFGSQEIRPLASLAQLATIGAMNDVPLTLDPERDLYGSLLFHTGRFQRIQDYLHLRARECVARIISSTEAAPFAYYLPSNLLLGDFLARDAVIHCIQACIPQGRLLPIAVEVIRFASYTSRLTDPVLLVCAKEREQREDLFTYDVEVWTSDGQLKEQWIGLQLRLIEALPPPPHWHEALLGPYLERKLNAYMPDARLLLHRRTETASLPRSETAFQALLGAHVRLQRRPDGKPILLEPIGQDACHVSASHHGLLTLVVANHGSLGCDIEAVIPRSLQCWQDLLGLQRLQFATFLSSQADQDLDEAATCIWAAGECLKKAGVLISTPLHLVAEKGDGWVLLRAGAWLVATYLSDIYGQENPLVFAFCCSGEGDQEVAQIFQVALEQHRRNSSASL